MQSAQAIPDRQSCPFIRWSLSALVYSSRPASHCRCRLPHALRGIRSHHALRGIVVVAVLLSLHALRGIVVSHTPCVLSLSSR